MQYYKSFDIETAPVANILELVPSFVEADVKLGNLKDLDKVKAKIDEARANHATDFVKAATLDPKYGRILVVAVLTSASGATAKDEKFEVHEGAEAAVLSAFWKEVDSVRDLNGLLIGYYTHQFDLPFLLQRSWINEVKVPSYVRRRHNGRSYWLDNSIDLHDEWLCGVKGGHTGGLDALAKACKLPGKTGEDGATFYKLWETDKPKAMAYLRRDVEIPRDLALKMGIL